jgi:AP-2 complex subunit sigma-1
MVKKN